ncbi:MAG: flagellar FliJ family protein [Rariglobus sp.]
MKKFRFPLHSVAIQRKLREGEKRERFAAAVRASAEAESALQVIQHRIAELETVIARERSGTFQPAAQTGFLQALRDEQALQAEAVKQVAKAKAAAEVARQAWIESRRDVRLIETLETKARAVHRHEFEREEQALLDDRTNALAARAG